MTLSGLLPGTSIIARLLNNIILFKTWLKFKDICIINTLKNVYFLLSKIFYFLILKIKKSSGDLKNIINYKALKMFIFF